MQMDVYIPVAQLSISKEQTGSQGAVCLLCWQFVPDRACDAFRSGVSSPVHPVLILPLDRQLGGRLADRLHFAMNTNEGLSDTARLESK